MNIKQPGQSWLRLTAIQLSGTLCMPVIMVGQALALAHGVLPALTAIILGNSILCAMSILFTRYAITTRANTTQVVNSLLGTQASRIFGIALLVSMLGWFSIQLALASNTITYAVAQALPVAGGAWPVSTIIICLISLITLLICAYGIEGIARASQWFFVPLVGTLGLLLFYSPSITTTSSALFTPNNWYHLPAGIATVIACSLALVIDLPTYYHHAHTSRDGIVSCVLLFLVGTPLIQMLGILLISPEGNSLLDTAAASGTIFWKLWIMSFLALSCIAINAINLFSAHATLTTLIPFFNTRKLAALLVLASISTLGAFFDVTQYFSSSLEAVSVMVASIAALLIVHLLTDIPPAHPLLIMSIWGITSTLGFFGFITNTSFTGSALIDTFSISALMYYILLYNFKLEKIT